jgi:hypothetical protein
MGLDDKERTSVDMAAAWGNGPVLALFEREDGKWMRENTISCMECVA